MTEQNDSYAIEIENLHKSYKDVEALKGVTFKVPDFRKNPYFLVVYIGIIFFESSFPSWHCV